MKTLRAICFLAAAVLCSAADRALLVGVGVYSDPRNNLPGIDRDVRQEAAALRRLGFPQDGIKTLMDRDATLERIRSEIRDWLAKGAGPNDRIVFYFSGHGSLSLDDKGKEIAVLVAHDTKVGNGRLLNALGGPELGDLLAAIGSRHVMVVADACHSGHMTDKAKGLGAVPKFLQYPGMPTGQTLAAQSKGPALESRMNHILFSACRREETAGATQNGSILTIALGYSLDELLNEKQPVTMKSAHARVLEKLQGKDQHPELSGDSDLKEFDWGPHGSGAPPPPPVVVAAGAWEDLQRIFSLRAGDIPVRLSKPSYRNGEQMTLQVDVPSDGYLNIVAIGDKDREPTVLFPNSFATDNHVSAGKVTIPTSSAFVLSQEVDRADEENELMVLFTTREINLFNDGAGADIFHKFTEHTRSTVVRAGFGAGFAKYRITLK